LNPVNELTAGDLYYRLNNGEENVLIAGKKAEGMAHISPNGKWLAWVEMAAGGSQNYVEAFPPEGGQRLRLEVANGIWPKWSADGAALYFISYDRLMRQAVVEKNGISFAGEPRLILKLGSPPGLGSDLYDVATDESRVVYTDFTYLEPAVVVLIRNWPAFQRDPDF